MKILVLSNLYPPDTLGGYEIGCEQMTDALRARGHEVLVAAGAPRHPVPTPRHVRRVFDLVDEWTPNAMGTEPLIRDLDGARSRLINAHNVHALTTLLDELAPDVVFVSNLVGLGGLGLMACLQYLKVPWVWHLGDCVPRILCSRRQSIDRAIPTLVEEFSRQLRGRFIMVSQKLRDEIESCGIELRDAAEVIPCWITGVRPATPPRRRDGGTLRIMSAGRATREKGVDLLIEAAGLLRDAGCDDFVLDIYGQVDDPSLDLMIRTLGLNGRVRMLGGRSHQRIQELYGEYDVFAFPSREGEPFGLVPLEAAAWGCLPLIARRCGAAEWLVHGVHCLKVDRTAGAFAAAWNSIHSGEVAVGPIARRAREAVWRDFHIDAILPRIERHLIEAAGQPRAGGGTSAEAYRLSRLAERLTQAFIQETSCA